MRGSRLCQILALRDQCTQSWTHTYRTITYNVKHTTSPQFSLSGHFATRYVGNRLTLIPSATQHATHFQQFLSLHFYGPLIYLETAPGLAFLGFTSHPDAHSKHNKATNSLTDIMLSPHSASPATVLKSSLQARAILAKRLATLTTAVTRAMEQLTEVCTRAGYGPQWIRRCITKEKSTFVAFFDSVFVLFYRRIKHSLASRSHLSAACIAVQKVSSFCRSTWRCVRTNHFHTDLTDDFSVKERFVPGLLDLPLRHPNHPDRPIRLSSEHSSFESLRPKTLTNLMQLPIPQLWTRR